MSEDAEFTSIPGSIIGRYLELQGSLGRKYGVERGVLKNLDRYLNSGLDSPADIDQDTFSSWMRAHETLASGVRRNWMRIVYNFCLYRRRTEPACFLPDPALFPPLHVPIRPHIFSEDEILRVLAAADSLGPHSNSMIRREVYRLAVVLLYTTGMRRGELAHLTLGDYSPIERTLLVRASKFHKSRLLPLSADGAREMETYLAMRHSQRLPADTEAPLLVHGKRGGYSPPGLCQGLRALFRRANVRTVSGALPRIHDLRHTFAVHALLRWYRATADLQVKLPYLAAYMGHVSIVSTEYYLPFVSPLAEAASEKFENQCGTLLGPSTRTEVSS
jgi:integrase